MTNETATATLAKPLMAITNAQLKEAVVAKFGSLSHFCRLSGRDLAECDSRLRRRSQASNEYLVAMLADAKRLANTKAEGYHLTDEARKSLSAKLATFPSIREFCRTHKGFSNVFVSRVINGHTEKATKKVKQLANTLSVAI